MVCVTMSYLNLFFLLAGADACFLCEKPTTTIASASASVPSAEAQEMAKYVDGWTQANEKGFKVIGTAMQAVNANDFSAARMQADVAVEAFQTGLSFCSEAQDLANRLPEPASSGATQAIRSAQKEISENLVCAKLLSQNMQQGQRPVATCFKAWIATTSPPQPNLNVFSFVKFPIVMLAGMATVLALLVAGMYQWKKRNASFASIETDRMLVVDGTMSSDRWARKVHDGEPDGHRHGGHPFTHWANQHQPQLSVEWQPVGHRHGGHPLIHWANQHQPQLSPAGRTATFVA